MKSFILFLLVLGTCSGVFAQGSAPRFEERVDLNHPNESVDFTDPTYLNLPLLIRDEKESISSLGISGVSDIINTRGNKYCQFLGYSGLLGITEKGLPNIDGSKRQAMKLRNNVLIQTYVSAGTVIKELRCKL